jgi:protease-4
VVRTARVFHADEALGLNLVDRIGYLSDAFGEARSLAGLPDGARVVAYRRAELAEDTVYNTTDARTAGTRPALVETGPLGTLTALDPGFHYLWLPGAAAR